MDASAASNITKKPYLIDEEGQNVRFDANSAGTRAVRKSIISVDRRPRTSVVGGDRKITSKDIHNVFQRSQTFSYVTEAQIERVQNMHKGFSEAAEFCFNYNVLLIVASALAALGLMSNSSTTIIASMLVSPIM
ncbi:MAG: hypothetical protein SGARI_004558, partial [Bacillariaceae sp.]